MINKYFIVLVIMLSFLLSACAPPRPAAEAPQNKVMSVDERKKETKQVSSWELSGAIAAKNKNKGWTASINWLQKGPQNYQIRLFGPLGSGTVIIDKKGGQVTYKDGPKTIRSSNANTLLAEQTGIRLPVDNLYYWARGMEAPGGVQSKKYDNYGHLKQLRQDGYTINFLSYTSVKGKDLPSKVQLTGHDIFIKLIVKRWVI